MKRHDPLLPNALLVAATEYAGKVRTRIFHVSTVLLATLAVLVAFLPLFARIADPNPVTRVGVVASDPALADRSTSVLTSILNGSVTGQAAAARYEIRPEPDADAALADLADGSLDAVLIAERQASGRLSFRFHAGETIGDDRLQQVSVAAFGVAVLDYSANNPISGFQMPDLALLRPDAAGGTNQPVAGAEYASRRIIGIVFSILLFLTLSIYGMWVAAGVVAEKSSRVMELMISAASPWQLVVGKILGIGAAGLTQVVCILVPAIVALAIEDPIARAIAGPGPSVAPSLAGLTPALLLTYVGYFVLGFALYALIYAAAASLVSRQDDLQVIALPLSLIAIAGYLLGVLALTGGTNWFIRLASYIPFWSPFVMLTRLTVGRVEPWELVLSVGLLAATIAVTLVVAVRVYSAGVLLYGQRPGLRTIVAAVRSA